MQFGFKHLMWCRDSFIATRGCLPRGKQSPGEEPSVENIETTGNGRTLQFTDFPTPTGRVLGC